MTAPLLDGRALAGELRADLRLRTAELRSRACTARLAVLIVGEDSASVAYVRSLANAGSSVGVDVRVDTLPADAREALVRTRLFELGEDRDVHGVILQQPLPAHLAIRRIADAMPPHKTSTAQIRSTKGGLPSAPAPSSFPRRRPP